MNLSNLSKIGNYFLPNEISTFTILVHFIVRYKSCLNSLISLLELTMKYFKPQATVKVSPRPIWKRFNASWSSWPTSQGPTRQQVSGWGQINGDSTVLLVNVVNNSIAFVRYVERRNNCAAVVTFNISSTQEETTSHN